MKNANENIVAFAFKKRHYFQKPCKIIMDVLTLYILDNNKIIITSYGINKSECPQTKFINNKKTYIFP